MESPSTLRQNNKGFTLIEILITIIILLVIFSLGLFISFDFYRSYAFRSEKNTIISILQKARNESLNNVDQIRHGVHIQANPLQYTIFEGSSFNPADPNNVIVNSSYGISINNPALPFDVIFDQLSGSCVSSNCASAPLTITISDGIKSYDISVNNEGQISW